MVSRTMAKYRPMTTRPSLRPLAPEAGSSISSTARRPPEGALAQW